MQDQQYNGVVLEDKWGKTYLCSSCLLARADLGDDCLPDVRDREFGRYFLHDLEPSGTLRQLWVDMYQHAKPWMHDLSKLNDFQLRDALLQLFAADEIRIWQLSDGWGQPPKGNGIGDGGLVPASGSSAGPAPVAKTAKPKGGGVATDAPVAAKAAGHESLDEGVSAPQINDGSNVTNGLSTEQRIAALNLEGHAPIRHGGPNQVTDTQLENRAVRGIDPASGTQYDAFNTNMDGSPSLHKVGKNATAFTSDEALLKADESARNSAQFEQKIVSARMNGDMFVDPVEIPLVEVFGADYKSHVRGVTRLGSKKNPTGHTQIDFTDGTVKAIYRLDQHGNVKLHTLYPNPKT
ncbi:hypothetical protein [Rheinheimera baltica]|uniref:hypothetical protein n=1 Tax=Rheinheimera baltica TaxID=67576 RepID=UPI00273FE5C4|nr:hypothetical protein [Rheinheimera baltica]MDP5148838.1 hypothetical protein [Rheinheimera baltica]